MLEGGYRQAGIEPQSEGQGKRPVLAVVDEQAELENVNSRYTVEGFDFTGTARYKDVFARLSGELQDDLKKLIGEKFNQNFIFL